MPLTEAEAMVYTRRSARLGVGSSSSYRQSPTISVPETTSKRSAGSSTIDPLGEGLNSCHILPSSVPKRSSSNKSSFKTPAPAKAISASRIKRPARIAAETAIAATQHMMTAASTEDRQKWKGWCEIESEPAFFNVILHDLGIRDVKVQEVISLDDEMLTFLPKPVYGLIFLFQFKEDDPSKQEDTCPDHVWFANQVTSNACASIALLNIVMNVPDIELGPHLECLKLSTATLVPAQRGHKICNDDFVRQTHNSFTRKMDMLNADLALSNDVQAGRYKKKSGSWKNKKKKKITEYQEPPGFHFIAFTPIKGCVWKLDGLEQQPTNLGSYHGDWMGLARPLITERMQQYEGEQIQFNLLSLCRSPLLNHQRDLATNIQKLIAVEKDLNSTHPDWLQFAEGDAETILRGPDSMYGVTQDLLNVVEQTPALLQGSAISTLALVTLLETRVKLINTQGPIKAAILEEKAAVEENDERVRRRRYDHTPMISKWVRLLAEYKLLGDIVV